MRWLALDLERLRSVMVTSAVVDLRNIYQPEELESQGLAYACVEKSENDLARCKQGQTRS
jgi:hypothetical protein